MFDFEFEPWIVGDTSTLGFMEQLQEEQVKDAIDYIRNHYGDSLTKAQMEAVFTQFDIDYMELPGWLQVKFDEFDISDFQLCIREKVMRD